MLTIEETSEGLTIKCAYAYRHRVKLLPDARFDFDKKLWIIPKSSLQSLQILFPGELYFKTPLWKIEGKSKPPKHKIEYFSEKIETPKLEVEPFEYQKEGIQFIVDRLEKIGFCLLGDQMGLGKTLCATGAMKWYKQHHHINKILIVCSKSLKYQWASELNRYTGWSRIYITGDTPKQRKAAYDAVAEGGILIANYHNFLNDSELIGELDFDLCIIDEAHNVKNRKGKMNNAIAGVIQNKKTILMTAMSLR